VSRALEPGRDETERATVRVVRRRVQAWSEPWAPRLTRAEGSRKRWTPRLRVVLRIMSANASARLRGPRVVMVNWNAWPLGPALAELAGVATWMV